MPLIYRKKTCPTCGTEHRKRGPYCSRSCGNHRTHSEEHKEHLSKKTSQWINGDSDTAEIARWQIGEQGKGKVGATTEELVDDYPVPPMDPGIGPYEIDSDGDIWF